MLFDAIVFNIVTEKLIVGTKTVLTTTFFKGKVFFSAPPFSFFQKEKGGKKQSLTLTKKLYVACLKYAIIQQGDAK